MTLSDRLTLLDGGSLISFGGRLYNLNKDGSLFGFPYETNTGVFIKGRVLKPWIARNGYYHYSLNHCKTELKATMHRLLAFVYLDDYCESKQVDHIDGNKLNNSLENIRMVTPQQNRMSYQKTKGSSRYRGVGWFKPHGKWRARAKLDGKEFHGGYFDSEEEAALAYNKIAIQLGFSPSALNKVCP